MLSGMVLYKRNENLRITIIFTQRVDINKQLWYNGCILNRKRRKMSCLENDMAWEQIQEDLENEDSKGLLESEIFDVCIDHRLHADDDRDEILQIIADQRWDARSI
jgi:hypothetical protein